MRIAIAHAAWMPERKATLARLVGQLSPDKPRVFESLRPEHASIWATRIWESVAKSQESVAILNDDVTVHPKFRLICEAIVTHVPDELISLHCQAPDAAAVAASGRAWARCYWLSGPGYILTPRIAGDLLDYSAKLPWDYRSRINEDNLAIHYAYDRQRPIWQSIPAIVHHDVTTPSSLGYENHSWRTPSVPWVDYPDRNLVSAYWRPEEDPPLIANPWAPVSLLDRVRRILRSSRLCTMCLQREGVVGTQIGPSICTQCAHSCYALLPKDNSQ